MSWTRTFFSAPTITHGLNNYTYLKVIRLCVRISENKFHSADFASFRSRSQRSIYVSNPRKGLNNFQKENLFETFFFFSLKLCFRFFSLTTQQSSNSHLLQSIQVLPEFCVYIPQPGKLLTLLCCKDFPLNYQKIIELYALFELNWIYVFWQYCGEMFKCTAWNPKSCSFQLDNLLRERKVEIFPRRFDPFSLLFVKRMLKISVILRHSLSTRCFITHTNSTGRRRKRQHEASRNFLKPVKLFPS